MRHSHPRFARVSGPIFPGSMQVIVPVPLRRVALRELLARDDRKSLPSIPVIVERKSWLWKPLRLEPVCRPANPHMDSKRVIANFQCGKAQACKTRYDLEIPGGSKYAD